MTTRRDDGARHSAALPAPRIAGGERWQMSAAKIRLLGTLLRLLLALIGLFLLLRPDSLAPILAPEGQGNRRTVS